MKVLVLIYVPMVSAYEKMNINVPLHACLKVPPEIISGKQCKGHGIILSDEKR